jgi:hypothetical protein
MEVEERRDEGTKTKWYVFMASSKTASLPRWYGDVSCHISKNERT